MQCRLQRHRAGVTFIHGSRSLLSSTGKLNRDMPAGHSEPPQLVERCCRRSAAPHACPLCLCRCQQLRNVGWGWGGGGLRTYRLRFLSQPRFSENLRLLKRANSPSGEGSAGVLEVLCGYRSLQFRRMDVNTGCSTVLMELSDLASDEPHGFPNIQMYEMKCGRDNSVSCYAVSIQLCEVKRNSLKRAGSGYWVHTGYYISISHNTRRKKHFKFDREYADLRVH